MDSRLLVGILFLLLFSKGIGASEAPGVIVLYTVEEGVVLQLKAELDTVGYRPVMLSHPPQSLTPIETDKILSDYGAIALINITNKKRGVEVWVSSGTVGGGKLVETVGGDGKNKFTVDTILKSVESLRASLMQFDSLKSEDVDEKRPVVEKVEKKQVDKPRLKHNVLSLEPGVLTSFGMGEFSPPLRLDVSFVWWLHARLALFGAPSIPFFSMKAENDFGRVSVWEGQIVFGVRQYLNHLSARFQPWLGIGVGPALLRIVGDAGPGWKSSRDTLLVAVISPQVGLFVSLTKRIGLQMTFFTSLSMFLRPMVVLGNDNLPTENPVTLGGKLAVSISLF